MNTALLYASTVLIWGSTWLAIKYQLGLVAPEVSIAYRFLLAAVILLGYCIVARKRMRYSLRDHLGMAQLGFFLFSANYFVFYLATYTMTTGLIAVVFSGIVVTNIIFGALFLGNPIRPRVALGAAFGLAASPSFSGRISSPSISPMTAPAGCCCASPAPCWRHSATSRRPPTRSAAYRSCRPTTMA